VFEYYTILETQPYIMHDNSFPTIFSLNVITNLDQEFYERKVVTIWDWMSDIYGFYGSVTAIAASIHSLFVGHIFINKLVGKLYNFKIKFRYRILDFIVNIKWFKNCKKKNPKRLKVLERGKKIFKQELDVIELIRFKLWATRLLKILFLDRPDGINEMASLGNLMKLIEES